MIGNISKSLKSWPTKFQNHLHNFGPGLLICVTVAAAAQLLSSNYGAPQMLFALLLGMAFNFLTEEGRCANGIDFSAKTLLRFGVALLGLRITIDQILSLGLYTVALLISGVVITLLFGICASKILGRRIRFGILTGGAVAICGASFCVRSSPFCLR